MSNSSQLFFLFSSTISAIYLCMGNLNTTKSIAEVSMSYYGINYPLRVSLIKAHLRTTIGIMYLFLGIILQVIIPTKFPAIYILILLLPLLIYHFFIEAPLLKYYVRDSCIHSLQIFEPDAQTLYDAIKSYLPQNNSDDPILKYARESYLFREKDNNKLLSILKNYSLKKDNF